MEAKLNEEIEKRLEEIGSAISEECQSMEEAYILGSVMGVARANLIEKGETASVDDVEEAFEQAIPDGLKMIVWEFDDTLNEVERACNVGCWFDKPDKWYYNLQEAMKYYLTAANSGSARAAFNLGIVYYTGQEDKKHNFIQPRNDSRAAGYFWYASFFTSNPEEKSKCFYYLAKMYFYGYGMRQDWNIIPQLGALSNEYRSPMLHASKLDNLVMAAMNLMDGNWQAVPEELLDEVETSFSPEFHNEVDLSALNSHQAKYEILKWGRKQRFSSKIQYMEKCPKCGSPMVLRTSKKDNNHRFPAFLGCTSYPACYGTTLLFPEMK